MLNNEISNIYSLVNVIFLKWPFSEWLEASSSPNVKEWNIGYI